MHKPTNLRFRKLIFFFPYISSILIPTWPNLLIPDLDILPGPCQDPVKGQEPPIRVLAILGLLLLPLNSLPFMTPEAS